MSLKLYRIMKKLCYTILSAIVLLSLGCCSGRPKTPVAVSKQTIEKGEETAITTPPVTNKSEVKAMSVPCVFNIYVENSGSMYGYVKGATDFENVSVSAVTS